MKVAALYDVHGMPWALEAVLAEAQAEADAIVFGGDYFGGPVRRGDIRARSRRSTRRSLRGNAEDADPRTARAAADGRSLDGVLYCHATPTSNTPMTTVFTPEDDLRAMFGERGTFVIGHTHHQFDRRVGDLRVVNAGSVGMPYEGDVAAFWLLVVDGEPQFRATDVRRRGRRRANPCEQLAVRRRVHRREPARRRRPRRSGQVLRVAEVRIPIGRVGRPHGLDGAFFVEQPSDDARWWKTGASFLADGTPVDVVAHRTLVGAAGDPARHRRRARRAARGRARRAAADRGGRVLRLRARRARGGGGGRACARKGRRL